MSHTSLSRIKVWDAPVRVMHWLLALSFSLAWLTAEVDSARGVHIMLGYTVLGLIVARLIWGLVGTRHARFSAFVRGPAEVWRYAMAYAQGRPPHRTGHNPLGAMAVVAMLGLGLATGLTGLAMCSWGWGDAAEELHEALASAMLAVVGLHVLAHNLQRINAIAPHLIGRARPAPS
jgi:cytochrome b